MKKSFEELMDAYQTMCEGHEHCKECRYFEDCIVNVNRNEDGRCCAKFIYDSMKEVVK